MARIYTANTILIDIYQHTSGKPGMENIYFCKSYTGHSHYV